MSCELRHITGFWKRMVAHVVIGQVLISLLLSGCIENVMRPPSPDEGEAVIIRISIVSTGLGAVNELYDSWMARDIEFGGSVVVTGGGCDSDIWTERAISPSVVQEYANWIISCAKLVDGIHAVVIECDGDEVAIWRKLVSKPRELVEVSVQIIGENPAGFASQWDFRPYVTEIDHSDNVWAFELPDLYLGEFIRRVTFVGKEGRLAVEYGIIRIEVMRDNTLIDFWLEE